MDPSQAQSPPSSRLSAMVLNNSPSDQLAGLASNSSPSEQLAAMVLNSSPDQQAPPDAPRDAPTGIFSRTSLFGNASRPHTPPLAKSSSSSPSPNPTRPSTPSPLDRRLSNNLNPSPLRAPRDDGQSDQTSGDFPYLAREPSLPYEAWETVSNTFRQSMELRSAQPAILISGLLRHAC